MGVLTTICGFKRKGNNMYINMSYVKYLQKNNIISLENANKLINGLTFKSIEKRHYINVKVS